MYSGGNMLYGGPLGAYLSGVYQSPSSIQTPTRRSRTYLGTPTSQSSSYYTPQPRRKYDHSAPESPSRYTSVYDRNVSPDVSRSRTSTYIPSSSSYYARPASSYGTSFTPSASSGSLSTSLNNSTPHEIDYKKLYEEEKRVTDKIRLDLEEAAKEISENKSIAEKLKRGRRGSVDLRRMERQLSEFEEEIKLVPQLQDEGDKLRAENRSLARVVTRLSRDK